MTAPLRFGLLSTARINAALVGGAAQVEGVEVTVAGSRDLGRAQAHAGELGVPRAVGSYEDVLADPEVDAVYVSLPNGMHVDWSIRALEAGKHVLCEKPLTRHPRDAERAFDAAERHGLVLAEGFMWRHHPQARRLEELLGAIGDVRLVRSAFSFTLAGEDPRLDPALDGGALMDVGCYCVSALRLVCGEPETVTAEQVLGGGGVDVRMAATLRFAGDVLGHFDCAFDLPARDELEVVGEHASLFLDEPWNGREATIELRRPDAAPEPVDVDRDDPYAWELRDFAAAVAGTRPLRFGRDDAVAQARTIAALYESAATGRPVAP